MQKLNDASRSFFSIPIITLLLLFLSLSAFLNIKTYVDDKVKSYYDKGIKDAVASVYNTTERTGSVTLTVDGKPIILVKKAE